MSVYLIMLSGLLAASYVKYIDLARTKSEAVVNTTYKQNKLTRVMLNRDRGQCEWHQD